MRRGIAGQGSRRRRPSAEQTCAVLAGMAATLAAALTPVYLALFSGGAG